MLRGLGFGFVGYALMSRIPRAFKELGFISPNRSIRKSTMALGCLATQRDLTPVLWSAYMTLCFSLGALEILEAVWARVQ